jgi:hypothetical protein
MYHGVAAGTEINGTLSLNVITAQPRRIRRESSVEIVENRKGISNFKSLHFDSCG